MDNKITLIRLPLIDNFKRIIQSLASRGRHNYQQYLIKPLVNWNSQIPIEPMEKILSILKKEETTMSNKLPLLYKMALVKSVSPEQLNLSIPGNLSIDFLNAMRNSSAVVTSDQALEFINILREPFKEYSDNEFVRMNKQFEKEINTADNVQVEKLLKIREGKEEDDEANRINQLSQKSLVEINKQFKSNNFAEMKNQAIKYLLNFSDTSNPNRHQAIHKIFEKTPPKIKNFGKEVMDAAAIIIYHEILKAIKNKQLSKAVKNIGKYAVLFRGNPNTPNFHEVDSFEKKFFEIIEERNLWDKL